MISDDKNSSNSWQETLNAYRDKVARSSSCEELEEAACDLDLCLIPGDRIPYLDTAWALYNTITANPGIDDLQLTTGIISRIWAILADEEADNNALGAEFIHYWQRLCQDASKLHLPRCISLPNRDILDIFKAHVDLWKHTTNSIVARVIHEYHAAGIKTTKDKLLLNAMWSHLLAMADLYSRISSTDYYHQESLLECACQLISTLDASDLAVFGLVLRRSLPDAGQKRTDYTKHKCHEIVINLAGHFIALDDAEKFRVFKEWQSQFVPLLRNYEPRQWRRRCTTDLSATLYFDVAPDTPITGQVFNVTQNGKDILLRLGNEYPFCA